MWWCFIVVPPYIGKDHKYEQDHIIIKVKPLNEQNTMNKKKPRTQYHDQQRPNITIGELIHLKEVQEVLLDILFPPFVFCCHTYTQ
jgi:hypothetical protein